MRRSSISTGREPRSSVVYLRVEPQTRDDIRSLCAITGERTQEWLRRAIRTQIEADRYALTWRGPRALTDQQGAPR